MIRMYVRRLTRGRWPAIRQDEHLACVEVARLVHRFVDDEIEDPVVVGALIAHVDVCAPCNWERETLRTIKATLAARRVDPSAESVERLRAYGASLMRES
jgi:hypothetical protein